MAAVLDTAFTWGGADPPPGGPRSTSQLAQDGLVTAGSIIIGTVYKVDAATASVVEVGLCRLIASSLPKCAW